MFNVNDYWDVFVSWLHAAIELFVPVKKICSHAPSEVRYKYIQQMYNRKRNLWHRWCRSKRIDDKQKYQRYATKCKHAVESYNVTRELQCVSKKTSPTFLAVTRENIVGFSCLAHMLPRK